MADRAFNLASAFDAATNDRLAQWVVDFLASPGNDNPVLGAALATRENWWAGPVRVPLTELTRLAGRADDDVECPIEPHEWEDDVDAMADTVEEGWKPPPLLAEYRDGELLLHDGNHRHAALERAGETEAWVIVFFDSRAERDRFADSYDAGVKGAR